MPNTFDGQELRVSTMWTLGLLLLGAGLNVWGLLLAGGAYLSSLRTYDGGPVWPWMRRAADRAKQVASRAAFWRRRTPGGGAAEMTVHVSMTATGYGVTMPQFTDAGSDAERFAELRHATELAFHEIGRHREMSETRFAQVEANASQLSLQVGDESARVEALAREVGASGVRRQLAALFLIGLGTIISLVPSACSALQAAPPR